MAKIKLKRILSEDLPQKYSDLTDRLLLPINDAIDSLSNAMNNNLSIADNFAGQETILEITSLPTANSPIYFKNNMKGPCRGIICIAAEPLQNGALPTGQPFFSFENSGSNIKVTNISSLAVNTGYSLRIYCFM
jgi:hypothetical protein